MNLLIITSCFYPYGDATSVVVGNMSLALKKMGHNVSVLSFTNNEDGVNLKEWNGIKVLNEYIFDFLTLHQDVLKLLHSKRNSFYFLYLFLKKKLNRYIKFLSFRKNKLSLDLDIVSAYNKIIKKTLKTNKFDLCLVTLMPHNAVWSIFEVLAKKEVKTDVVVLQYDTYWNNEFPDMYISERQNFERFFIDKSLFVMTTPQIFEINKDIFDGYENKVIPSEFPCVVNKYRSAENSESKSICSNKVHCVFLGTLYKEIRPPQKIIEILKHFSNKNIYFDFYGKNQHLISLLDCYESVSNFVLLHGNVSSSDSEKIQKNADILVNIDNTNLTQVPSKIFDYMCTGKRIINFYFSENSPSLPYLKKYPSCFNINVNTKLDKAILEALISFINNTNYRSIPFSEIEVIFKEHTPEYVANQFLDMYKKCKSIIY